MGDLLGAGMAGRVGGGTHASQRRAHATAAVHRASFGNRHDRNVLWAIAKREIAARITIAPRNVADL
ncbi:MAG: hypothetical protein ACHQ52_10755, partial [Candidatus Eisenbacteria bacterium]